MYKVLWDTKSLNDLENIDQDTAVKIVKKVDSYLVLDPRNLGKPLSSNYQGLYRYRYGDYRVVYEILIDARAIRITKVGA
jgi:mRNA interferase RelE/StbE